MGSAFLTVGWEIQVQSLVADVLKMWREAERVLHGLPPSDAAHDAVRRMVIELRGIYAQLSEPVDVPEATVERAREVLESAVALVNRVRGEPA